MKWLSGRRAGKRKIPLASKNEDCLVLQPCLPWLAVRPVVELITGGVARWAIPAFSPLQLESASDRRKHLAVYAPIGLIHDGHGDEDL